MLAAILTANPFAAYPSICAPMSSGPAPSALSNSLVTPCVSMFSAVGRTAGTAWLWMLMKPGATMSPRTSMSARARTLDRSPTRTMNPSVIATSARKRAAPVPSRTVPPRKMRSYWPGGCCASAMDNTGTLLLAVSTAATISSTIPKRRLRVFMRICWGRGAMKASIRPSRVTRIMTTCHAAARQDLRRRDVGRSSVGAGASRRDPAGCSLTHHGSSMITRYARAR